MADKKTSTFKVVAISLMLIIIGVVMLSVFLNSESKKTRDGKLVTCTVTSVFKAGKHRTANGYYIDDNGNEINAEIINTGNTYVGAVLEGYVTPDKPGTVALKTPAWLACLYVALSFVFMGGGIAVFLLGLKRNADMDLLVLEGEFAQGQVIDVRRDGAGNYVFYAIKIAYTDLEGTVHTFEECTEDYPKYRIGDTVHVKYARKKNGKYANIIV
jgi:hypothetical protein